MPEGDTVWLAATRLREAFAGTVLTRTDFRVPRYATADLSGRTVREVVSRGKHMLTRIEGDVTLHTHFKMDGTWRLHRPDQRWSGGAEHQIRVVLANADWVAVGYRMPVLDLLPTAEEHTVVGHLGPDLLGDDWDLDEAVRRLRERPGREVGPALLDQRNLAGIGNLYKTEVLFLRGISPWTAVGAIDDLPALVTLSYRLMMANRDRWAQVTTGDTRMGQNHWIFERQNKPCRRCGNRIRQAEQVEPEQPTYGRLTYWCPHCQQGPAPS
ncbi:MAG TPA: DNA-formamidopyrimidine glycosylase family protein [Mycobacteriales bacterium]|nr:DNA-formamidopyrimidine glycosylase family protein [Mycobacteriales bacterium]